MTPSEQRAEALQRANKERSEKAAVKRGMKRGDVSPIDVLRDPPQSMTAEEFLLALPRVGPVKMARILAIADLHKSKRLYGATDRQIGVIEAMLEAGLPGCEYPCESCGKGSATPRITGLCRDCLNEEKRERRRELVAISDISIPIAARAAGTSRRGIIMRRHRERKLAA